MATNIKPTLANLEREEKAVVKAFNNGRQIAGSLREHVYNIKQHELWRAVDCNSFKDYCEQGRITIGTDDEPEQCKLSYDRLSKLATNGEIEQHLPKNIGPNIISDDAMSVLGKLRVERTDRDGKVKKTHDLDLKKIKAVVNQILKDRERTISDGGDGQVTAKIVKETIEKKYGYKPPKTMAETINMETKRINRLLSSMEAAIELDEYLFSDAEEESPGCAKRLAAANSKIASFLRSSN